jgi:hypothetical protein
MKICSKCNVEKELDQFQKYWHSTQQKERTRGYCTSCYYEQKKLYKESIRNKKIIQPVEDMTPPVVIEPVYDTNLFKCCKECGEWKLIDTDFYRHSKKWPNARCKECEREIEKQKYEQEIEDKGGHDMCPVKVGVYADKYQQEQTEGFLTALGWKKSENGVWWKEGFKTPEGIWLKRNNKGRKYKGRVIRGDKGIIRGIRVPEDIQLGIIEMYKEGSFQKDIIKKYSVCKQTIRKVIANYLSQSK